MKDNLRERYGPHPKKKERKKSPMKEGNFLQRSFDWLKWRLDQTGGAKIHHPCLEH